MCFFILVLYSGAALFLLKSVFLDSKKCVHLWEFQRNGKKCIKCHLTDGQY
jgi:hypothetical protein